MSKRTPGVLLIDLQRAFCAEDGTVALQGGDVSACREAAARCGQIAKIAHQLHIPVIWTRFVLDPNYLMGGRLLDKLRPGIARVSGLKAGTRDVDLLDDLPVEDTDLIVNKPRYSAFLGCEFEVIARSLDLTDILIGGVTTSMCVESTVRDASQRDYYVTVVKEAVADFDASRHAASMDAMEFGFSSIASLRDVDEILQEQRD